METCWFQSNKLEAVSSMRTPCCRSDWVKCRFHRCSQSQRKITMLFQCSNKLPISARELLYQNLHEPFVTGHLGPDEIFRSGSLKGVRKKGWLRWNQKFSIPVCHRDRFLIIKGELGKKTQLCDSPRIHALWSYFNFPLIHNQKNL